jgi:hypothetical protein
MLPGEGKPSLPGYELLEEIGRGSNGVVYRAYQPGISRHVALKLLGGAGFASPGDAQRFRQEAEALARLDHPHIVPVYEVGEIDVGPGQRCPFFSMRLLEGGSLAHRVPGYTGDPRAAAALVAQVARAVHHAHQRGVLHRDLKPSNILLDADGRPHVADFGLARLCGGPRLTQTGAVVGTPGYLAPEQAAGGPDVTTAADVHALGAVLYELLTGRPPYQADTVLEVLRRTCAEVPARPRALNRRLDRDLETVCLRCLEKDPARRYASGEALADDLERWLRHERVRSRRSGPIRPVVLWARRRPAVAALLASIIALASTGLGVVVHQVQQTAAAQDQLDVQLYVEALQGVEHSLVEHNTAKAEELLDACPRALRGWEWHCLKRQCRKDIAGPDPIDELPPDPSLRFTGDSLPGCGRAYAKAVSSPDGHLIASIPPDSYEVDIWDSRTGKKLQTLACEPGCDFTDMAFSPDGQRLATMSWGGGIFRVKIWMTRTRRELFTLFRVLGMEDLSIAYGERLMQHVRCDRVFFTRDGTRLVVNRDL